MPGFARKNWDLFSLASHALRCVRLARFFLTLRPRFPDFFTDFEKKKNPDCFAVYCSTIKLFLKLGIINIHNMNFKKMKKKKAMKKLGSPCLFTRRKALKLGYFHWFALKIQIIFIQN